MARAFTRQKTGFRVKDNEMKIGESISTTSFHTDWGSYTLKKTKEAISAIML